MESVIQSSFANPNAKFGLPARLATPEMGREGDRLVRALQQAILRAKSRPSDELGLRGVLHALGDLSTYAAMLNLHQPDAVYAVPAFVAQARLASEREVRFWLETRYIGGEFASEYGQFSPYGFTLDRLSARVGADIPMHYHADPGPSASR